MADPGCAFEDDAGQRCGRKPTQLLAIGMTAPDPAKGSAHAGEFHYEHFCEEHLPIVQKRLGQK